MIGAVGLGTPLCQRLGIEHPVFCAGMGAAAGPELVAAVSGAGGFGVLGASGCSPAEIRRRAGRVRELTGRPFGVNFIIAGADCEQDREFIRREVAAASEQAAAVVLFWGDPEPYVEAAHVAGAWCLLQVGSAEEARSAAAAGVDAIIAQGVEAGGHVRGTTPIWALLPEVVQAVAPLPVLASGGIGDGDGVARALRLGAQGVSLGTRFVASDEAWAHPEYKQRIVHSTAGDTFYGELFDVWWPDAPHRVLRNRLVQEWDAAGRPPPGQRPGEGTSIGTVVRSCGERTDWPRYAVGVPGPDFGGDIGYAPLWAGESCAVVNDIKPAAVIVRDLIHETEAALMLPTACGQRRSRSPKVTGP
jgi:NAD(P)H-dependent flavin oxidoreductase YrpB (nitropropane dioxygenase family)